MPFSLRCLQLTRRRVLAGLFIVTALVVTLHAAAPVAAQEVPATTAPAMSQPAVAAGPGDFYGIWVLVPPLVTIVLAIAFRQVIPALAIGILVAAYMLSWFAAPWQYGTVAVGGLRMGVEQFVIGALTEVEHVQIVVFTLFIGGMVGIIAANGGTPAIVDHVARWASNRRRGQVATWFAGLLVFFDDYANAMIVGPSMRPVCDRLKISRAKLAYLVDSTAAPVSSIALIGTWIGAEIGYIQQGLNQLSDAPAFLANMTAYRAFLGSIPYRFYAILALIMVLLIGLLDRDFGPMRKAEQEAQAAGTLPDAGAAAGESAPRGSAWYAGVPVLVLVFMTLALLMLTGWPAEGLASIESDPDVPRWIGVMAEILYNCNSYISILYGALAAIVVAAVISLATRTLTIAQTVDSATAAMSRMLSTMMVLVLAWSLSSAMESLQLGRVAATFLQEYGFEARWLPLLVFGASCVVSFATGTSWGTMGILCPAAVTIAAGLLADTPTEQAYPLFYASVGGCAGGGGVWGPLFANQRHNRAVIAGQRLLAGITRLDANAVRPGGRRRLNSLRRSALPLLRPAVVGGATDRHRGTRANRAGLRPPTTTCRSGCRRGVRAQGGGNFGRVTRAGAC